MNEQAMAGAHRIINTAETVYGAGSGGGTQDIAQNILDSHEKWLKKAFPLPVLKGVEYLQSIKWREGQLDQFQDRVRGIHHRLSLKGLLRA